MCGDAERAVMQRLRVLSGVGERMAAELIRIGIRRVEDLVDRDPEELYLLLCEARGRPVDRCVLYVFRCIVYYATASPHDPELLKWWNWKD